MKHRLLVSLDALLDTRIASLSLVNQEWAKQLVRTDYTRRISDELQYIFSDIDIHLYREKYRNRNVETLMNAIPTQLSFILEGVIATAELESAKENPEFEDLELEINYYPYNDLTSEELEELSVAISARAGLYVTPKMVYIPYEVLTFDKIEVEKWSTIVLYDFEDWWLSISKNFDTNTKHIKGVPSVNLIVPALIRSLEEAKDVKRRTLPDGRVLDPFETTQFYFAEIISITFINPEAFSLVLEDTTDD